MPVADSAFAAQLGEAGALQDGGDAFHALADTMPHMVWSVLPDGRHDYYNARWYQFTGLSAEPGGGDAWIESMHPDDRDHAVGALRRSLATGAPFEDEYRRRHHSGEYRWVIGRTSPIVAHDGAILRWIGTCTDIQEAKATAEHNEILSRELSHRIKNIFAVISGLIGMTARANAAFRQPARDLQDRIAALGRAHEFVRPHVDEPRPEMIATTLHGMLAELFKAYPAFEEGRLTVRGEDMVVSDRGATPIALVFHELATNAMKYGALSVDDGRVAVAIRIDGDEVVFDWRESGGPKVLQVPDHEGFGSRLTELAIRQQLGGDYERRWREDGLEMTIRAKMSRLTE